MLRIFFFGDVEKVEELKMFSFLYIFIRFYGEKLAEHKMNIADLFRSQFLADKNIELEKRSSFE